MRCDSCACGSPHLKSFAFLCVWANVVPISNRCEGGRTHVLIQGELTKRSATYVPDLLSALADVMADGIQHLLVFERGVDLPRSEGLESQLINQVCTSASWECSSVWIFRVTSHINIMELSAVVRLVAGCVKKGKSLRLVILVDSNVLKCASAKGRSSSRALSRILSRLAALCVVGGLCVSLSFIPTRLNPADDPTRDTLPPRWFARLVVGFLTGPFWCCFVWVLLFSVSVIAPFFVLRIFRLACLLLLSSPRQQARRALTEPAGRALRWNLIPL